VTGNPSPIEAARLRHRLAEVARRTGITVPAVAGNLTVRCPFPAHGHPDRRPSMRLYLADDRYYCFGCGAKGDAIQWVRDAEGLRVADAIRHLDSGRSITNTWAGNPYSHIPQTAPTGIQGGPRRAEPPDLSRTCPECVSEALQAAWRYYSAPALRRRGNAYLATRGIDISVLEDRNARPEVGHTSNDPVGLVKVLHSQGFTDDELVDAGLAQRYPGGGRVADFYRQRVLIPLYDEDEHCIGGMIGRNVSDGCYPKYKNPPRTHAYDKSVNLYRPMAAPAHPNGRVVIVEGTLDAIAIAVAAIKVGQESLYCPVTQSGRELSEQQMERILELHPNPPVLGFDGDTAGLDSAVRYALAFAQRRVAPLVTVLPNDHDPASWLMTAGPGGISAWADGDHQRIPDATGPRSLTSSVFLTSQLARREAGIAVGSGRDGNRCTTDPAGDELHQDLAL
jgi:DNA primase